MNALEAFNQTNHNIVAARLTREAVDERIELAVSNRLFAIQLEAREISPEVIESLKTDGYKVEIASTGVAILRWDNIA
ncbi:hypothetical protein MT068_001383 [Salmonella enterica]|nr:hypothetical protein [Salmonella enterica]